jgi:hypothetical protein
MEMKEVYDNPNYSHILIGGQPFFILPSGELSGHVPVPSQGERLTPRPRPPRQIYEGDGAALANYNLGKVFYTGMRIRIRIGSGFNRVRGSGSGSVFEIRIRIQEGKNDPKK